MAALAEENSGNGNDEHVLVRSVVPGHGKPFSVKDHISAAKEIRGRVTTLTLGRNNSPKILRYDMAALVKYSALLTCLSKGTVFTMDTAATWNVLIMILIGTVSCALACLSSLGDFADLADLNVEPLENLANQINAFVPFCLALYVSLTLTRWWALRISALGKVFDAFANVSMIISCELNDKKWQSVRNQVAKYGFASIELLVQAARNREEFDALTVSDLLTEVEVGALKKTEILWQRPMMLWVWIMRICVAAMDHHKSPAPRTAMIMTQCIGAREGMATINTYLDTQLPFAYVHLITLLVNVQNVMIAIKSGIIFATGIPSRDWFLMIQQFMTLCVVCFIYQALLQISYTIMDPFGDDILDFPIKAYTNYLATTVDAMLEAQPECPVVAEDGSLHRPRPKKVKNGGSTPQQGAETL
mmetsp:Transcript_85817/g.199487  ORF Transcript_85817/g.199487 Transcript_85817/m.199487 type:complete len:417 (-) Transcript_85817:52-1302(-)